MANLGMDNQVTANQVMLNPGTDSQLMLNPGMDNQAIPSLRHSQQAQPTQKPQFQNTLRVLGSLATRFLIKPLEEDSLER